MKSFLNLASLIVSLLFFVLPVAAVTAYQLLFATDRYESAEACLRATNKALGEAIPKETEAIRESFLQAATFVGRDAEMAQMTAALKETKAGKSAIWLIGGESGVGKTRLIDNVRLGAEHRRCIQ